MSHQILSMIYVLFSLEIYIYYISSKDYETPEVLNFPAKNKKENLYIGIDFGTYKSGIAYNFGENIDIKTFDKLTSVPSEIILNKSDLTAKNYGYQSNYSFSNFIDDEKKNIIYIQKLKRKLFQFDNKPVKNDSNFFSKTLSKIASFISSLFNKQIIEDIYPINNYYNLDYFQVIEEYFRVFSDEIIEKINSLPEAKNNSYSKNETNWIVSVPWYLDEFTKNKFLNSLKEAGLDKINLVIEQEAASLALLNDNSFYENLTPNTKHFLMVDLGGYTIDLTLFEIKKEIGDIMLKRQSIVSKPYGSMNINKNMSELLDDVFGQGLMKKIKKREPEKYLETMEIIEDIKKKIDGTETNIYKVNAKFERKKNKIEGNFKKLNYSIKYDKDRIFIPAQMFHYYIKENNKKIIHFMQNEIYKLKKKKIKFEDIFLYGGYSNNVILVKEIRNKFEKRYNISSASISNKLVMHGALIYRIKPFKIYSRRSTYTLLMETCRLQNYSNKNYEYINRNFYQKNYMKIFEYEQDIENNKILQIKIQSCGKIQSFKQINFYHSFEKINKKILKDNLNLLGKLIINLNNNITKNNIIDVLLTIEIGSYLKITASDLQTNSQMNTVFIPHNSRKHKCSLYQIILFYISSLYLKIINKF